MKSNKKAKLTRIHLYRNQMVEKKLEGESCTLYSMPSTYISKKHIVKQQAEIIPQYLHIIPTEEHGKAEK